MKRVTTKTETREVLEFDGHTFDLEGVMQCDIELPREPEMLFTWHGDNRDGGPEPFVVHDPRFDDLPPDFWRTDQPFGVWESRYHHLFRKDDDDDKRE